MEGCAGELGALRAERLATSCLTTRARGTRPQTAIPWRANAAVPAFKTSEAPSAYWDFATYGRTSVQNVGPRHARPRLTAVTC